MYDSQPYESEFLNKATEIIEANITNPKFGVSMLAKEMGMSRSNLHRKVNENTKITVSQFINHIRLKKAKEILRHTSNTVSEVAYEVGFSNVSYFIKCFHDYYGYSPGKVGNREEEKNSIKQPIQSVKKLFIPIVSIVVIAVVLIFILKPFPVQQKKAVNSIVILPVENFETNDTITINGVLKDIRDNLCRIKDIDLKPRISVLQYQNSQNSNFEIAKKYNANYLIQPRTWWPPGKNNIYLSLELIEVKGNKHINTFNHKIDSNSITSVHLNFINDICHELDVTITQEEQIRIGKLITNNKSALKHYHTGLEYLYRPGNLHSNLEEALKYFKITVELDNQCAHAYACIAKTYYQMDIHWTDFGTENHEILYGNEINYYADKAMQIDPDLDLSNIAKALYYQNEKEYQMAIDYFEKVLEQRQNDFSVIGHLVSLHRQLENREKSIEYALGIINSVLPEYYESISSGIELIYTQTSKNYRFLGFFKEAEYYINKALEINPDYTFASTIKSQIILDLEEENNYQKSIDILKNAIDKDSIYPYTYIRVGQSYYMLKDYNRASNYYNKYLELSKKSWTDGFDLQSKRLAVILRERGELEKALIQINNYRIFAESQKAASKIFQLSGYHAFFGDTIKTLEYLQKSSNYDHLYHRIRQLRDDPVYEDYRKLPQFQKILSKMQTRWENKRDSTRVEFKKKGLLLYES